MKRAFTIIELLAVVAVLGVLVGVIVPGLRGAREAARDARCLADLRSIGQLVHAYRAEWRRYPRVMDDLEVPEATPPRSCVRDQRRPMMDGHTLLGPVAYLPGRLTFEAWVDCQRPPGPLMASDQAVWAGTNRNGVWRDGEAGRIGE